MFWHSTEHDLYIRQPEIRIQYDNPLPHLPELYRQIDRRVGFPHATLAAGNGDHSRQRPLRLVVRFDYIS